MIATAKEFVAVPAVAFALLQVEQEPCALDPCHSRPLNIFLLSATRPSLCSFVSTSSQSSCVGLKSDLSNSTGSAVVKVAQGSREPPRAALEYESSRFGDVLLRVGGVGGVTKNREPISWLIDAVEFETISSSVDRSGECMMACIRGLLGTATASTISPVPYVIGIQSPLT